ncbi:MAG: hypothetical protein IAE97_03555 [Chthoniobacterales bacterium]|nr:hypothetical protein [Chthoniobacterales bacterium]
MLGIVIRMLGLLLCAGLWWWLSMKGRSEGIPGGMIVFLAAHGVLLVAAILLAKPVAGWLGDMTANLFMPGARNDKPQPMYSIPEGRMAAEDYAGALEAYAELAAAHPGEIAPHLRMMEIWLRVYRDPESARTIHANALQAIKGRKNREKFAAAAAVILAEAGIGPGSEGGV